MRAIEQRAARRVTVATALAAALPLLAAGCQVAGTGESEPSAVAAQGVAEEPGPAAEQEKPSAEAPAVAEAPTVAAEEETGDADEATAALPAGVAARVNGETVTRDELIAVLLKHYGQRALESIIQQRVIRQEAARLNVTVSKKDVADALEEFYSLGRFPQGMPLEERKAQWARMLASRGLTLEDFERDMRAELLLRELVARRINITDEAVRAEFDRRHGEKLLLREIVLSDQKKADEVHAELTAGGDFGALAAKHSTNRREGRDGGKISVPVARGTRTKAFEEAAWGLQEGEFSKPFEVARSWVILKLDGKTPREDVKFDDVKDRYRKDLLRREEARMKSQVLGELMDTATIERRRRLVEPEKP